MILIDKAMLQYLYDSIHICAIVLHITQSTPCVPQQPLLPYAYITKETYPFNSPYYTKPTTPAMQRPITLHQESQNIFSSLAIARQ